MAERSDSNTRQEPPSEPAPARDPRLEIPEILRKPIDHPSLRPKPTNTTMTGLGDLSKALAIGLDFLFMIAAGGLLGWLADRAMGSSPAGILVGLGVGFLYGTIRLIQRLNKQDAADRARTGQRPPSNRRE